MPTERTMSRTPKNTDSMLALLARWTGRGWLRELDRALACFIAECAPDAHPLLVLAAAFASHQLGRGHVCLDLAATLDDARFALSLPPEEAARGAPDLPEAVLRGVTLDAWQAALSDVRLVAEGAGSTPLVLVGTRLYLRRYWQYEQDVRARITGRLLHGEALRAALPLRHLRTALDLLFPSSAGQTADWQKVACAVAAGNTFSIITGGPGTGKTTTVVRLLALLQGLALQAGGQALNLRLAAPTGKAAARLSGSIAGAVNSLRVDEAVRAAIPVEVTTLHRLLGSVPDSRRFRHHAGHPLTLDVLVVDEASMVDLEMMAALLDALPAHARLIMLGDKDQLASVEAGAVLGELCARAREGHYLPAMRDWLEVATGESIDVSLIDERGKLLDQAVAMLRVSHRFTATSGIGELAEAVNLGDIEAAHAVLAKGRPDLSRLEVDDAAGRALRDLVIEGGAADDMFRPAGYRHYLEAVADCPAPDASQTDFDAWARAVIEAHGRFQVLCALRSGPWGVEGLNQRIAEWLHGEGLISSAHGWFCGRPVMVTRNDYGLHLMNGDVGVTLVLPQESDDGIVLAPRVAFLAEDTGAVRWILPSRLQAVETVFAMTVHKSQGSEFTHAALVLPDKPVPILTRELLYTGITRAREHFTLALPARGRQVFDTAIQRRVLRASGLLGE